MLKLKMLASRAVYSATLILLLSSTKVLASLPVGIEVSITPTRTQFSAADKIALEIKYSNVTTEPIRMLRYGTALEGRINEDFLSVFFDGRELHYRGRLYKRSIPQPSDYVVIAALSSESAEVELTDAYPIQAKGEYTISYRASELASTPDTPRGQAAIPVATQFRLKQNIPVRLYKQPSSFAACNAGEISALNQATAAAESLARISSNDLRLPAPVQRATAARFEEWFGVYAPNRWARVQQNFDRIYSTLRDRQISYDCTCNDSAFAFVYISEPYDVYLCRAFWSAPLTGTDSKAGTIIHELSHFTVVSDTRDHVYGQSGARALADNDPVLASANADSHEYFSENTPFLPMPRPADLIVASVGYADSTARPKQPISVSGSVANVGNADASAGTVTFSLRGAGISPISSATNLPAIDKGESGSFQLTLVTPDEEGEYSGEVCVSAVAEETNSTNNCARLPTLVIEEPEFSLTGALYLLLSN